MKTDNWHEFTPAEATDTHALHNALRTLLEQHHEQENRSSTYQTAETNGRYEHD